MNFNESIKAQMAVWPKKLTSAMEIHREHYSQSNNKSKQKPIIHHPQQILTQAPPTRRLYTAQIQKQQPLSLKSHDQDYITLTNLSNILCVLRAQAKANDKNDAATDTSASTSTNVKQRGQQHLQETATRWWRAVKSSTTHASETSTVLQQYTDENIPLPAIVSHSTRQMDLLSRKSAEFPATNVYSSFVSAAKISSFQHTRQEPLIIQPRSIDIHSYDHRRNFFERQRVTRQT